MQMYKTCALSNPGQILVLDPFVLLSKPFNQRLWRITILPFVFPLLDLFSQKVTSALLGQIGILSLVSQEKYY